MKTHNCLRCRRHSLFQTGAFWACGVCSYAITQAALQACLRAVGYPQARVKHMRVVTGGRRRSASRNCCRFRSCRRRAG